MNFVNMKNSSVVVTCLFLLHLLGCYAGPVTRDDQPRADSLRQDFYISSDEKSDLAETTNESFIGQPTTEDFDIEEPETVNDTVFYFYLPGVSGETEQPTLPLDVDVIHNGLLHSDSIETVTKADIQGMIESDPAQKLEEPSYSKTFAEQEPLSDNLVPHLLPMDTSEFHNLPTVAASSDPEELPLMYPLVPVPIAPLVTPISFSDLPLESFLLSVSTTLLPEKEITSSPEAQDHSSVTSGSGKGDNVGALPLDLDPKQVFIFDSKIQVDQPKCLSNTSYDGLNNGTNASHPFGSNPKLRQLRFPPISNTQDNFDVQVNWAEFM